MLSGYERLKINKIPRKQTGIEIKKTLCAICNPHSHCGIDAHVKNGTIIKIEGSKEHPKNQGTLCSKGSASRQYIYNKDRILSPLLRVGDRGSGNFKQISWDESLHIIEARLNKIKKESGPESVMFYSGYTKWFRPFLKRLAHSFGSPNYATESSVCSTAARLAVALNYGYFGEPDIKNAECLLVWSKNPFYSNTSNVRHLLQAKERGLKIIEVGPLITPMTAHANIHLRLRPGTSGALALGLAHVIIKENLHDRDFIENWTNGFHDYAKYVQTFTPQATENITGISADLIVKAARLYATSKPAALLTSASPTVHHTNGVQNHRALTALVGLTGNFDVPGGNHVKLPSWLYISAGVKTRQKEWEQSRPWEEMAPRIGQEHYPVWCEAIHEAHAMQIPFQIKTKQPYPLRAMLGFGMRYKLWPGSDFMLKSLKELDFFVNVDLFMTDTCNQADIVLPACSSFERSELKLYSEQYAMWTQPVIDPLGESRSDTDIIFSLAERLAPDDKLMNRGYEASIDWILEPSGITLTQLKKHPEGITLKDAKETPYLKYREKGFPTPSGKMEFNSIVLKDAGIEPLPHYREPVISPISTPEVAIKFPLVLTTGSRLPMYQHSRTFRMSWTRELRPDASVDINPIDADKRNISAGDMVSLATPRNSLIVKANLTEVVPPGVISIYHAWPDADVNILIEPDYLDPISGFPGYKSYLCEVAKVHNKE